MAGITFIIYNIEIIGGCSGLTVICTGEIVGKCVGFAFTGVDYRIGEAGAGV